MERRRARAEAGLHLAVDMSGSSNTSSSSPPLAVSAGSAAAPAAGPPESAIARRLSKMSPYLSMVCIPTPQHSTAQHSTAQREYDIEAVLAATATYLAVAAKSAADSVVNKDPHGAPVLQALAWDDKQVVQHRQEMLVVPCLGNDGVDSVEHNARVPVTYPPHHVRWRQPRWSCVGHTYES